MVFELVLFPSIFAKSNNKKKELSDTYKSHIMNSVVMCKFMRCSHCTFNDW